MRATCFLCVWGMTFLLSGDSAKAGARHKPTAGSDDALITEFLFGVPPQRHDAVVFRYPEQPPQRYDVVVFRYPQQPAQRAEINCLKRITGLPSESVGIPDGEKFQIPGVIERITIEAGKVEIRGNTIKIEGGKVEIIRQPIARKNK